MKNYGVMLQPGETITKVIHRSLISLVPTTFVSVFLVVLVVVLGFAAHNNPNHLLFHRGIFSSVVIILTGIALIIFLAGIYIYSLNVLIFTNQHLIEVEQNGLFSRVISQVSFNREQDISGDRTGFFATIFNYGNVTVQSAGENVHFVFRYAPNPEAVANDAVATNEASMNKGQGLG